MSVFSQFDSTLYRNFIGVLCLITLLGGTHIYTLPIMAESASSMGSVIISQSSESIEQSAPTESTEPLPDLNTSQPIVDRTTTHAVDNTTSISNTPTSQPSSNTVVAEEPSTQLVSAISDDQKLSSSTLQTSNSPVTEQLTQNATDASSNLQEVISTTTEHTNTQISTTLSPVSLLTEQTNDNSTTHNTDINEQSIAQSPLFISEINYQGSTYPECTACAFDKWVELYNASPEPLMLDNYTLRIKNSTAPEMNILLNGYTLAPFSYGIIANKRSGMVSTLQIAGITPLFTTGKILSISNNQSKTIDIDILHNNTIVDAVHLSTETVTNLEHTRLTTDANQNPHQTQSYTTSKYSITRSISYDNTSKQITKTNWNLSTDHYYPNNYGSPLGHILTTTKQISTEQQEPNLIPITDSSTDITSPTTIQIPSYSQIPITLVTPITTPAHSTIYSALPILQTTPLSQETYYSARINESQVLPREHAQSIQSLFSAPESNTIPHSYSTSTQDDLSSSFDAENSTPELTLPMLSMPIPTEQPIAITTSKQTIASQSHDIYSKNLNKLISIQHPSAQTHLELLILCVLLLSTEFKKYRKRRLYLSINQNHTNILGITNTQAS